MRHSVILLLLLTLSVSAMQSDKNHQVVKSARIFAIGGIGYAGVITDEETAFNALCKAPDAAEQFRRLLREATIEGQIYALLGLRQVGAPDYKTQDDRYRRSTRKVNTGSGCEIGPEKCRLSLTNGSTRWHLNRSNRSMKPTHRVREHLSASAHAFCRD